MDRSKFRFKGYEFKCNPQTFTISCERNIAEFVSPFSQTTVQEVGVGTRSLSGEGVIFGDDVLKQYDALNSLFLSDGAGTLFIPGYKPFRAFFAKLSVTARPAPNLLYYSFKFIEQV